MTGLESIINEIEQDAKKRADEIISKAKEKADEIINEANKEAEEIKLSADEKTKEKCNFIAERNKSASELEHRYKLLSEKQRIISDMIDNTYNKLKNLPDKEYFELILRLVKKHQTGQKGELALNQKDKARLPKDFSQNLSNISNGLLSISDDTRKIDAGFVLIYGGTEENCSFKAIFDSMDEQLRDDVKAMLFE